MYDTICVAIAKVVRSISKEVPLQTTKLFSVFDAIKTMSFHKEGKWYSVMFAAFQKQMKETNRYIEFADWWDFENFIPENFEKEKGKDGKEIMALAEQAYIAYSKNLLPKYENGQAVFNKDKVAEFLPKLDFIIDNYPQYQYPSYFKAKLLLSLGDRENMLSALIPFAKKKRNDFWVWQIFSEAYNSDAEKVFACYCRALICKSPEMMLVGLRQKMAKIFIDKQLFNEAKVEIDIIIKTKTLEIDSIPSTISNWIMQEWYKDAAIKKSNAEYYKKYAPIAEALLFSDVQEEIIIVEYVNQDKKFLNFIASETKFGFFKYDRFFRNVSVGDILKVRFQEGSTKGFQLYTGEIIQDDSFKSQFFKKVEGKIKINDGKVFGFLGDIFINPTIIEKFRLTDGSHFSGNAIKSFNKEKNLWNWKLVSA